MPLRGIWQLAGSSCRRIPQTSGHWEQLSAMSYSRVHTSVERVDRQVQGHRGTHRPALPHGSQGSFSAARRRGASALTGPDEHYSYREWALELGPLQAGSPGTPPSACSRHTARAWLPWGCPTPGRFVGLYGVAAGTWTAANSATTCRMLRRIPRWRPWPLCGALQGQCTGAIMGGNPDIF